MSPTSLLMCHNPFTAAMGDTEEMRKAIQLLDEVKESIINAYQIKTGLSRAKLSHLMDNETWMNAWKAKELGFCDEVLYTGEVRSEEVSLFFLSKSGCSHAYEPGDCHPSQAGARSTNRTSVSAQSCP